MEIKININAPGLESAITNLAEAISGSNKTVAVANTEPAKESVANIGPKEETKEPVKEVTPEPTKTEETPGISIETVRVKLAELAQQGKQAQVKELISSYGVQRMSDVPQDKYAELLEKASEL